MEHHIATGWNNTRRMRLAATVLFAITGIVNDEPIACLVSAFFAVETYLNSGIFGVAARPEHKSAAMGPLVRGTLTPMEAEMDEPVERHDRRS